MLQVLLKIFKILVAIFAVLIIVVIIIGCFLFSPSRDEVARSISPDGEYTAVLTEVNGGATTSFGYTVQIEKNGSIFPSKKVAYIYGAVRNDSAYGVNLHWVSSNQLNLEYLDAKSAKVPNKLVHVAGASIKVILCPGIIDYSAPPGGMLYNLKGRPNG